MNKPHRLAGLVLLLFFIRTVLCASDTRTETPDWVPESLRPWIPWVLHGHEEWNAPPRWDQGEARRPAWPGRLVLEAEEAGAKFALEACLFAEDWLVLPGDETMWPQEVTANGVPAPVVARSGRPVLRLPAGRWRIEGRLDWRSLPLRMRVPAEIGSLELKLLGEPVPVPGWDAEGWLWFRQPPPPPEPETQPDFLSAEWFGLFEDGNPQWLHIEVQLSVAGRPREELVGTVLPEGWSLASVGCPLPVLVEDGTLRAQVRPGQWTVELEAFRYGPRSDLRFPEDAKVPGEGAVLIGLRTRPEFRVVELRGGEQVDVTQTRFPERWRGLPVFRWEVHRPLEIVERQRGGGIGPVPTLRIHRQWWLDEDGGGLTFQDRLQATGQNVWRLDVTEGVELGSVRLQGDPQLLTRHPETGRAGFEIRLRDFEVEAVGRIPRRGPVSASGWEVTSDQVETTLHLPVGWRLWAAFGADQVSGDWLTRWTLLDLFAVLVLGLAVQQLLGWRAGLLALATATLIYHEPWAPRWSWWSVIALVALLKVVRTPRAALGLGLLLVLAGLVLVLQAVAFAGLQLRHALYPQLETPQPAVGETRKFAAPTTPPAEAAPPEYAPLQALPAARALREAVLDRSAAPQAVAYPSRSGENLGLDVSAKVQTGPGIPEWRWRVAILRWNGPVRPEQTIQLWLAPPWLERILAVARALLTLALTSVLLCAPRRPAFRFGPLPGASSVSRAAGVAVATLCLAGLSSPAGASEFPPPQILTELRDRLLAVPPTFPGAADIPWARLSLKGEQLTLEARLEAAARCAVPLPARVNQWAPHRVWLDGQPETALRREDGSLWIVLQPGVHEVRVEGRLAPVDEWVWTFQLRPRKVEVSAPGWEVSGLSPEGVPSDQVFLRRPRTAAPSGGPAPPTTSYDRQVLVPAFLTVREIELGLRWKVRTTVRRLSPPGRPAVLHVPLVPGEQVLTPGLTTRGKQVEVRLGPGQRQFIWEGELSPTNRLGLATRTHDTWAEEWRLSVGQVWNVAFQGLPPIYEAGAALVPVWRPWPGEGVELRVTRPEALPGPTVTVESVNQVTRVGHRQRSSDLQLRILSSLGQDFVLTLPPEAESVEVRRDDRTLPLQKLGDQVTVPLLPGRQTVRLTWKETVRLTPRIRPGPIHLPVEASNVRQTMQLPEDRWVLTVHGPRLGPAVQYWSVLALAALLAVVLSRLGLGPMGRFSWFLLLVGLTQVPVWIGWIVVAWFAALQLRGSWVLEEQKWWLADLAQLVLVVLTVAALGVLYAAVAAGLLGRVEMFVSGNGSRTWIHHWYSARTGPDLPRPETWAISIWWYRLAMLLWALWLAWSAVHWLRWGWQQFSKGGCWAIPRRKPTAPKPPPLAGA
ncbi:hypothetical protein [Limisphaera sp. 4302-co]|uniref:hypothetical protein n=1 Tax=Limisphaera sp. 4302-co TaxID=3400417 RepID=UPI003C22D5D9